MDRHQRIDTHKKLLGAMAEGRSHLAKFLGSGFTAEVNDRHYTINQFLDAIDQVRERMPNYGKNIRRTVYASTSLPNVLRVAYYLELGDVEARCVDEVQFDESGRVFRLEHRDPTVMGSILG